MQGQDFSVSEDTQLISIAKEIISLSESQSTYTVTFG